MSAASPQVSGADLVVVGAYRDGMLWDMRRGDPGEREEVRANLAAVPAADPVHGSAGPLTGLWRSSPVRGR